MTAQEERHVIYALNTELSDRELHLIGSIVSQWGFLEDDIFHQTLWSFEEEVDVPTSMNNVQFTAVLKLWLERVVNQQDQARREVLRAQYDQIVLLHEYRKAVVHSRWEWRPHTPDEIIAVRVHKKSIQRVKFTTDDLADMATRLGQVRYWITYPGGMEQHAAELSAEGGYLSRRAYDLLTGRAALDGFVGP